MQFHEGIKTSKPHLLFLPLWTVPGDSAVLLSFLRGTSFLRHHLRDIVSLQADVLASRQKVPKEILSKKIENLPLLILNFCRCHPWTRSQANGDELFDRCPFDLMPFIV